MGNDLHPPWGKNLVDDEIVEQIKNFSHICQYKKGEYLFRQGESENKVYLLLDGRVELLIISNDGKKRTLFIYEQNTLIGGFQLNSGPSVTSAVCLTYSKVAVIDQSASIPESLERDIYYALYASNNYMKFIQVGLLKEQVFDKAEDRINNLLVGLSNRFGQEKQDSIILNLPLTHQLIADITGCSRITVSQILEKMKREKRIKMDRNKITFYK